MAARRKRARLSRSGDFDRVFRDGRSQANRFLVAYSFPRAANDGEESVRLGISVSRKVGGAAQRNAVKRALREAFWEHESELPENHDFVLVARPESAVLLEREGHAGLAAALRELIVEDAGREAA